LIALALAALVNLFFASGFVSAEGRHANPGAELTDIFGWIPRVFLEIWYGPGLTTTVPVKNHLFHLGRFRKVSDN
jgi:hypothetical protein